jgi:hypothetical protein
MTTTGAGESVIGNCVSHDRLQELRSFDESKAGVKGLVDAGITKIPRIFIRPPEDLAGDSRNSNETTNTQITIPVIDLSDIVGRRADKVAGVRRAAEEVGFFQLVNHGIAERVLEDMLEAARGFHELPTEVKVDYYTWESKVKYGSNYHLYNSRFANWRDTLVCVMGPEPPDPQELPLVCR